VPATLVRIVFATPVTVSPSNGLVAIDADGQFRPALILLQARVGDARGRIEHGLEIHRDLVRGVQVVADDLNRQASVAVIAADHLLLAARGAGADDDAGNARQLAA